MDFKPIGGSRWMLRLVCGERRDIDPMECSRRMLRLARGEKYGLQTDWMLSQIVAACSWREVSTGPIPDVAP